MAGNGLAQVAEAIEPVADTAPTMQLFIVAKDDSGFRGVIAVPDQHSEEARQVEQGFEAQGFEVTGIVGFDLEDAWRSCPAWFAPKSRRD